MRPRCGAKRVKSCSRYNVSTAASHGRGLGREQLAIAEVRTKWHALCRNSETSIGIEQSSSRLRLVMAYLCRQDFHCLGNRADLLCCRALGAGFLSSTALIA